MFWICYRSLNNETTRDSWRREQAAASKPISSHWLSGFQRNLSSHCWKSRVGHLIAGKAEWRKLERTSFSRSTLHRAVQLVNNPLNACKRKCAENVLCYYDKGIQNIKREMKKVWLWDKLEPIWLWSPSLNRGATWPLFAPIVAECKDWYQSPQKPPKGRTK